MFRSSASCHGSAMDKTATDGERDLYVFRHPKSTAAEACRAIRTNLLFMSPDRPLRTMLVTSSGPREGKSTCVIATGIAMAQSGGRVVLVDTDMRRPRLHEALGVPNDRGVSSVLVGDATLDEVVKSTEVPGLFVIPSGPIPPNPAELFHTQAFRDFVAASQRPVRPGHLRQPAGERGGRSGGARHPGGWGVPRHPGSVPRTGRWPAARSGCSPT